MNFFEAIRARQSGLAVYGLAPPKAQLAAEKVAELVALQVGRLEALQPDAVIVYDIQDEVGRAGGDRPFPFLPTLDPAAYARRLDAARTPKIVYRSISQDSEVDTTTWLTSRSAEPDRAVVLVGAAAAGATRQSLHAAYDARARTSPALPLGGIAIAERHSRRGDEHTRLLEKMARGCSFFVTQAVYDLNATKSLLSDYGLAARRAGLSPVPLLLTFSPCASLKTLEFMKWLGISVPRWLENDLTSSPEPLATSLTLCEQIFAEVWTYAKAQQVPVGINVESVSTRKAEIDASVALFHALRRVMRS